MSLEIGCINGKIAFGARLHRHAASPVESQFYAQFPDAEIEHAPVDLFEPEDGQFVFYRDLELTDSELFPIRRHPQYLDLATHQAVDSIAGIIATLTRYPKPDMHAHIQVVLQHAKPQYRQQALHLLPLLDRGLCKQWRIYAKYFTLVHLADGWRKFLLWPFSTLMGGFLVQDNHRLGCLPNKTKDKESDTEKNTSLRSHECEDRLSGAVDKLNRLLFRVNVRISVVARAIDRDDARAKLEEVCSSFRQFTLPRSNGFQARAVRQTRHLRHGFHARPFVLSAEEVATIWHLPQNLKHTPSLDTVQSRKLQPPANLPMQEKDLAVLGETDFRGQQQRFGICTDDRRRHLYILGKTGMGKSTLLENMICADIQAGRGVAVIDPHGDLVEACLRFIPRERRQDVILFDPADQEFPVAFNLLQCPEPGQRPLVVSGLMSVFHKLWPEAFSGRMEYILRNTLLALTEAGDQSMLGIMRMFGDSRFRSEITEQVRDQVVKNFWAHEFVAWPEKYRTEAVAALQNKIGQLLSTPLLRNIVGQIENKVYIRSAMDTGKIILVNLSKGKLGEDNSAFLGSLFVTKFQLDAMSRADIPERERRDFYLYVDEFQNFATESFATILSEARKYRLNLTIAHQYVNQLLLGGNSKALRDAVFGNVGSTICFQVGADDAEQLSLQLEELVLPRDILSLPKYHAYVRLMLQGVPSKPFSMRTFPPPQWQQKESVIEEFRHFSRTQYARERSVVEEEISWSIAYDRMARRTSTTVVKWQSKDEEERRKAKAKKMGLVEYRSWRDREMWTNEFNALWKRQHHGETLSSGDQGKMQKLQKQLEATRIACRL